MMSLSISRKNNRKNKIVIAILGIVVAAIVIGCAAKSSSVILINKLGKDDVFRINDSVCSLAEANIYLTNLEDQYESVYGNMWDIKCGDVTIEDYVKKTVIAQIAQIKSMALFSKEYNIELTQEEIKTINQAADEYFSSLSEAEIEAMGISKDHVIKAYSDYLLASKVYSSLTTETNTEVSDDEARVMTIQQIVVNKNLDAQSNEDSTISTEKEDEALNKAKTILEKVKNGEDFTSVAENYSDNDLCEISIDRDIIDESIEEYVFNMENDEVSDILETKDSYYIIKCINCYDIEATDANKEVIIEKRKEKAFDDVYEVFVDGLVSEFNEDLWNSVKLGDSKNVSTVNFFDVYNHYFQS